MASRHIPAFVRVLLLLVLVAMPQWLCGSLCAGHAAASTHACCAAHEHATTLHADCDCVPEPPMLAQVPARLPDPGAAANAVSPVEALLDSQSVTTQETVVPRAHPPGALAAGPGSTSLRI